MELGIKPKIMVLMCLVSLLAGLFTLGSCAPREKTISDLVIKVEWVEPVAMAAKPYDPPKSLASEYGIFHVILKVTNPNDFLVTVVSIEPEILVNDITIGVHQTEGPIYLPAGKEALVRFPIVANSLNMIKEVVMQKHVSVPDGVKILLGTWKDIQDGAAKYQVRGGAHITSESASRNQDFDIRWP